MFLQQIFNSIDYGIVILDRDYRIREWNRWMEYHSGLKADDIRGDLLFDRYPQLGENWFIMSCKSVLHFGNYAFFSRKIHEYCFPFPLDSPFRNGPVFMQQDCQVGPLRGDDGDITGMYLVVADVTDVALYEKRLQVLAECDGLTGLYSRRYFDEAVSRELYRSLRYGRPVSLILMDLDLFKAVNDTHGHLFGDFVLKKTASLLRDNLRSADIASRYGGEELALILPETGAEPARDIAEKIRKIMADTRFIQDDTEARVTASFGVSSVESEGDKVESLIARADASLYRAKESGRNAVFMMEAE